MKRKNEKKYYRARVVSNFCHFNIHIREYLSIYFVQHDFLKIYL